KALDGVSFSIGKGEVCGYLGSNGAGKSTTIKIICGMISPTEGSVHVDGISVLDEPDKVKKIIGYVPESGALFLSLTPYDFLQFVCRMYDIEKDVYETRINSFMELFGLANEINIPMHTFSKGMRQKVLLISSLIHDPELILWDEPLGGIDYETTQVVRDLVKDLSAAGKTFFYSTHLVESVDKICTKVIVLNKGKTVFDGSMDGRILENVMNEYSRSAGRSEKITDLYKNIPS
ncbi:partial ABC transporter ATP-binding protein NatA, partial [Methylococcales bacterium]